MNDLVEVVLEATLRAERPTKAAQRAELEQLADRIGTAVAPVAVEPPASETTAVKTPRHRPLPTASMRLLGLRVHDMAMKLRCRPTICIA